MPLERHVKLFRNGGRQVIRIPREFELPGEDVIICKKGVGLVIEPVRPRSLLAALKTWEPLGEDAGTIEDFPAGSEDI
jgi:antitoxin VapB